MVTSITEGTSQVVDVVYKTTYTYCSMCKEKEKAKAEQKISHLEYLEWYLEHEPECFMNHLGSAQVSFFWTLKQRCVPTGKISNVESIFFQGFLLVGLCYGFFTNLLSIKTQVNVTFIRTFL